MRKKTKKMLSAEDMLGEQLEHALPRMVTDDGLSATADYLGLNKATLGYWMLSLGIVIKRVALGPDDTLELKRNGMESGTYVETTESEDALRMRSEICGAIIDILREKSPRTNKEIIGALHRRGFEGADRNIIYYLVRNQIFNKVGHGVWELNREAAA